MINFQRFNEIDFSARISQIYPPLWDSFQKTIFLHKNILVSDFDRSYKAFHDRRSLELSAANQKCSHQLECSDGASRSKFYNKDTFLQNGSLFI